MMPSDYIIGHYHPFPEAIPHLEAGYSRVTHPSATKNFNKSKFSVRLACVRRAASVHPEPGSNSLKSCIYQEPRFLIILFHYESLAITDFLVFSDFSCLFPIKNQGISRVVIFYSNVQFSKCLCLKLFIRDSLFIISQISEFVKYFFRIFCDFFGNHLSKPLMFYPINSYWFPLLFQTTYLLYHSFFVLSSTFFDFFQNLFCDCRSFQATCLLYHKKSRFVNMEFSTKVALYLRIFLISKYKKADF